METGLRTISAGIPYTLLLRIEAIGFPTFRLPLYTNSRALTLNPETRSPIGFRVQVLRFRVAVHSYVIRHVCLCLSCKAGEIDEIILLEALQRDLVQKGSGYPDRQVRPELSTHLKTLIPIPL